MGLAGGDPTQTSPALPLDALDQLARLHRETCHANRLGRFLATAAKVALLFMLMTVLVFFLEGNDRMGLDFLWALLILTGVLALIFCHIQGHALSVEASLVQAARRLRLALLYLGFAWGAGAFLVLPQAIVTIPVILFLAVPCLVLALVLPDESGFVLFLVSAGMTVIGATLLRPFPHAMLDMSLILILEWGLFQGALVRNREPHPAALSQG